MTAWLEARLPLGSWLGHVHMLRASPGVAAPAVLIVLPDESMDTIPKVKAALGAWARVLAALDPGRTGDGPS